MEVRMAGSNAQYKEACAKKRREEAIVIFERLSNAHNLTTHDIAILDTIGWMLGEYDSEPRTDE